MTNPDPYDVYYLEYNGVKELIDSIEHNSDVNDSSYEEWHDVDQIISTYPLYHINFQITSDEDADGAQLIKYGAHARSVLDAYLRSHGEANEDIMEEWSEDIRIALEKSYRESE